MGERFGGIQVTGTECITYDLNHSSDLGKRVALSLERKKPHLVS